MSLLFSPPLEILHLNANQYIIAQGVDHYVKEHIARYILHFFLKRIFCPPKGESVKKSYLEHRKLQTDLVKHERVARKKKFCKEKLNYIGIAKETGSNNYTC